MNKFKEYNFNTNYKDIKVFKLSNANHMELWLSNYGATIMSIKVPVEKNQKTDIALGFDDIKEYILNSYYFGSTVGRYANRISNSTFKVNNNQYFLSQNEGHNHLHGGFKGLSHVVWDYKIRKEYNEIIFTCLSPDGQEGYPGNLHISLAISLDNENNITLKYLAKTDKATPVNLTNHIYFNLNGGVKDILNHQIQLSSNYILETNNQLIPTGKLIPVESTDFDFNQLKILGFTNTMKNKGFDHTYILNQCKKELSIKGVIKEKNNPVFVEFYTTEPSVQFYTGNSLNNIAGKNNLIYNRFYGICLEAQKYPDSPNHKNFPNTILQANEEYRQVTVYKINF